jgi:hypothetical protein
MKQSDIAAPVRGCETPQTVGGGPDVKRPVQRPIPDLARFCQVTVNVTVGELEVRLRASNASTAFSLLFPDCAKRCESE